MKYFLYFIGLMAAVVVIYLLGLLVMIYLTYPSDEWDPLHWVVYLVVVFFLLPAMVGLIGVIRLLFIEFGYRQDRAGGLWPNVSKELSKQKRWSNVAANIGIFLAIVMAFYSAYHVFSVAFESEEFSKILKGEQDELSLWYIGLFISVVLGLFMTITNRWLIWRYWKRREATSADATN